MNSSQMVAETIESLAKNKGVSVSVMLIELGMNKNALFTMKNSGYLPRVESLCKFADYFNISIDYLLGRTDKPTLTGGTYINGNNNNNGSQAINGNININATEQDDLQLLEMIKKLDLVQRSKIIAKIDEMENENKAKK